MAKLDKNQVAAITGLLVLGAKGATELWEVVNKDDRVSTAMRKLGRQISDGMNSRTPSARLEKQLDMIEEYAFKAAEKPAQATLATDWLQRATHIRERLALVQTMKGRDGRRRLRELQQETSTLLAEMLGADLEE